MTDSVGAFLKCLNAANTTSYVKGMHWDATSYHQPLAFVMVVIVKSEFTCIRIPQKIHMIDTGLPVEMGRQDRLVL